MTDFKIKSDTKTAFDFTSTTISGLATSSTLVAGVSSASIAVVSGGIRPACLKINGQFYTNGSSTPTAGGKIQAWLIPMYDNWPNPFTGSNANITVDSLEQLNGYGICMFSRANTATLSEKFYFDYEYWNPADNVLAWVVQSTGQNIHATSANSFIKYQATYLNGA